MLKAILIFTIATIINVTLSTIRSLCTINGGKWMSALTNAICYGFYPLIVMLTAKDTVSIIVNMIITAIANFICVWIIKYVEEKARKDKLWKVEIGVLNKYKDFVIDNLKFRDIPHNYVEVGKYTMFNIYCQTQKESLLVKKLTDKVNARVSAFESKSL